MNEIINKSALITGAGGGIGAATAAVFAQEGAEFLFLCDQDTDAVGRTAESIKAHTGCKCVPIRTDLSNPEEIRSMFNAYKKESERLDILVNCAGICPITPVDDIGVDAWDRTMSINLRSIFLCCQEALRIMRPARRGSIISVSSISGRIGGIATGADYVASKGAIIALTKMLAKSAGPDGINVNNVAPGFIATQMTRNFTHFDPASVPLQRVGVPDEVADVILFLASRRARYVTGTTLDVNGGVYMN